MRAAAALAVVLTVSLVLPTLPVAATQQVTTGWTESGGREHVLNGHVDVGPGADELSFVFNNEAHLAAAATYRTSGNLQPMELAVIATELNQALLLLPAGETGWAFKSQALDHGANASFTVYYASVSAAVLTLAYITFEELVGRLLQKLVNIDAVTSFLRSLNIEAMGTEGGREVLQAGIDCLGKLMSPEALILKLVLYGYKYLKAAIVHLLRYDFAAAKGDLEAILPTILGKLIVPEFDSFKALATSWSCSAMTLKAGGKKLEAQVKDFLGKQLAKALREEVGQQVAVFVVKKVFPAAALASIVLSVLSAFWDFTVNKLVDPVQIGFKRSAINGEVVSPPVALPQPSPAPGSSEGPPPDNVSNGGNGDPGEPFKWSVLTSLCSLIVSSPGGTWHYQDSDLKSGFIWGDPASGYAEVDIQHQSGIGTALGLSWRCRLPAVSSS